MKKMRDRSGKALESNYPTEFTVRRFCPHKEEDLRRFFDFHVAWEEPLRTRLREASTAEEKTRIEEDLLSQLKAAFAKETDPKGLFVAETKDKIIGFSRFHTGHYIPGKEKDASTFVANPKIGWVGGMAVAPTHRRKGVGSAMLQAGFEYLKSLGVEKVIVETGAIRFYEKNGFEVKGRIGHGERETYLLQKSA